jgi:hypothetical protein
MSAYDMPPLGALRVAADARRPLRALRERRVRTPAPAPTAAPFDWKKRLAGPYVVAPRSLLAEWANTLRHSEANDPWIELSRAQGRDNPREEGDALFKQHYAEIVRLEAYIKSLEANGWTEEAVEDELREIVLDWGVDLACVEQAPKYPQEPGTLGPSMECPSEEPAPAPAPEPPPPEVPTPPPPAPGVPMPAPAVVPVLPPLTTPSLDAPRDPWGLLLDGQTLPRWEENAIERRRSAEAAEMLLFQKLVKRARNEPVAPAEGEGEEEEGEEEKRDREEFGV